MTNKTEELSFNQELSSIRRCTNRKNCGEPVENDIDGICGWRYFDEVVLLVDLTESTENSGKTIQIKGFACRSCGALQPDGVHPGIISMLNTT